MADDLFRVFKSVRKLVREKTEDLLGNITPLERTLRDVVDEDSCAVSNSLLRHIAVTTNDAYAYSVVAQAVWQGISSEFWQRIYKCLCLLEYMILLGPERCRQDCADGQMTIRSLTQYRYHDGRREQGGGVRQRAENILKLINDAEYWRQMKHQAIQDNEKYAGGIENEPYISPISHMNLHTRASNPFFTGPQAMPPIAFGSSGGNPFGQANSFGSTVGGGFGRGAAADPPFFGRPGGRASPANPFAVGSLNSAAGGGGTFGLYDPGDDFATDDPFANRQPDPMPQPAQAAPADKVDPGMISFDDHDTMYPDFTANPASNASRVTGEKPVTKPVAASSLLDDDLFETSAAPPANIPAAQPPANASSTPAALLPDLLD